MGRGGRCMLYRDKRVELIDLWTRVDWSYTDTHVAALHLLRTLKRYSVGAEMF